MRTIWTPTNDILAVEVGEPSDLAEVGVTESMTVEYDKMTVGKGLVLLCIYLIPIVIMFVALSHVFYGAPVYSALLAMYAYRYVSYGVGAGVLVALYVSDFALVIRYSGSNRLMPASIAILSLYILLSSAVLRTKYSPYAALLVLLFHLPLLTGIARCSFCSNISPKVFFGLTSFFLTMIAVATLGIWFAWVYPTAWWGDDGTAGLADDIMEIYMSHGKDLVAAHGNDVICRASKNAHECNRHLEAELLNSGHCGRIAFGGHSALHKGEMLDFGQTCKAAKSVMYVACFGNGKLTDRGELGKRCMAAKSVMHMACFGKGNSGQGTKLKDRSELRRECTAAKSVM
eukprot:GEMP01048145.1.p1 GENE.GEMP01048145.1~~GEMP01048145.1.p1  ORF type:complete len:344 (+),score=40.83 GEMP01048145.1:566-1597(+)